MILGLDYDDTITSYTLGLSVLANTASTIHVITLNTDVTSELVAKILNYEHHIFVHIMPDSAFDTLAEDVGIGKWKANKCKELGVDLMIDDLQSVCDACTEIGVPSIQVHLKD